MRVIVTLCISECMRVESNGMDFSIGSECGDNAGKVLGIVPSPGKGSQWRNATGKTREMPPVGIWSTGEPVVSSEDDEQDNNDV